MEKEITSWTYTKGELAKDWLNTSSAVIAAIIGLIVAIIVGVKFPMHPASGIDTKFDTWLFTGVFFAVAIVFYFIFKASSTLLFHIYKLFFTIKNVDCSITSNKIIIGDSIKVLNDETKKIMVVKLVNDKKNPYLTFNGVEQKENKAESKFNYTIIVPKEELFKAEQVILYFKK